MLRLIIKDQQINLIRKDMTLVAAWVRHNNNTKELYVSSDSRLSGGRAWDIGPKSLRLRPRRFSYSFLLEIQTMRTL